MTQAFICDAIRTPIGRYGGALSGVRADDLGAIPLRALVERNPQFVSCPISNLVIGGHKQMADITAGYAGLAAAGVKVVQGEVTAIDVAGKKVRLASGSELAYDRLIVSPGVDFMLDQVGGLPCAAPIG